MTEAFRSYYNWAISSNATNSDEGECSKECDDTEDMCCSIVTMTSNEAFVYNEEGE